MKLFITGATGFVGRFVVRSALDRGHSVRAMARNGNDLSKYAWANHANVELSRVDLRSRRGLVDALVGVDAVIHLAAAKSGDIYAQFAGTVVATENLLWAMSEAKLKRLVHCSTFSVYDYTRAKAGSVLTEETPIEIDGFDRDEYAQTKLVQERLVRQFGDAGNEVTILRPGVIWGTDNWFTARIGMSAGERRWVKFGGSQILPLTYVENCAEALVLAAEKSEAIGQTLNVIDDEMPSVRQYCRRVPPRLSPVPKTHYVPYWFMRAFAGSVAGFNRIFLNNHAKVPGIFATAKLVARCKPLRYSNARIKQVLGWTPRYDFEKSLARSVA